MYPASIPEIHVTPTPPEASLLWPLLMVLGEIAERITAEQAEPEPQAEIDNHPTQDAA